MWRIKMPTIVIHGIGNHDPAVFRTFFYHVRDQLRASMEQHQSDRVPEAAFFPVYWGSWGPDAWYQGLSLMTHSAPSFGAPFEGMRLAAGVQAKSLAEPLVFDAGLEALQIVLSTPGPLHEVLDDLGISEAELVHAVKQTRGMRARSATVVKRLLVRAYLRRGKTAQRIDEHTDAPAALEALLALILDQPQVQAKGLSSAAAYPFLVTITALARHLRGSIMQVATSFIGDVMLYLARGTEVRDLVHKTIVQACAQRPNEPLVLIAHSLGGVIAYEYATDPAFADRPPIDLLVTVGSQVALFAEYGLFQAADSALARGASGRRPYPTPSTPGRWLNFYDPDDFLSFPIAGVFPHAAEGDRPCTAGKPFPASHSAYWDNPQLYSAIAQAYPALP
jgi:hypothetical protein